MVGEYKDSAGKFHGYLWDRGRFVTIDVPGAIDTSAVGITNRGQITLQLQRRPQPAPRFAVLQQGRIHRASTAPGAQITFAFGLNDRGQIVGVSVATPPTRTLRGFLLAKGAKGPFTTISRPGASVTVPTGINSRGQIVGIAFNPEATPSPQPTGAPPMARMA